MKVRLVGHSLIIWPWLFALEGIDVDDDAAGLLFLLWAPNSLLLKAPWTRECSPLLKLVIVPQFALALGVSLLPLGVPMVLNVHPLLLFMFCYNWCSTLLAWCTNSTKLWDCWWILQYKPDMNLPIDYSTFSNTLALINYHCLLHLFVTLMNKEISLLQVL